VAELDAGLSGYRDPRLVVDAVGVVTAVWAAADLSTGWGVWVNRFE
jgi:hypothetical protein